MSNPLVSHPWDAFNSRLHEAQEDLDAEMDRILDLIRQGDEKDDEANDLEDEVDNLRKQAEDLWEEADAAAKALKGQISDDWINFLTHERTDPRVGP